MSVVLYDRRGNAPRSRASRPLRNHINDIIRHHQSKKQCNLTAEELVLLALADSADRWFSRQEIGQFILAKIPYYKQLAGNHFFRKGHGSSYPILQLRSEIEFYLDTYDAPIHRRTNRKGETLYLLTAGGAYHYIQHCRRVHGVSADDLVSADKKPFPFILLPPEVRVMIYHLIFKTSGYRLLVGKRSIKAQDDSFPSWQMPTNSKALTMPSLPKTLALFSVSKEVRSEAMPEFFRENHFEFPCLGVLKDFLNADRSDRRKFVGRITVPYVNVSAAAAGARLLTECDALRKLTLILEVTQDPVAGHFTLYSSSRKFTSISQIPGLKALQKLRGIQLGFNPHLQHRLVDNYLRPHVTQPRIIKGVKSKKAKKTDKGPLKKKRALSMDSSAPLTGPSKKARVV